MANLNIENVVNDDKSFSNSTSEERQREIAIAAYYNAERRGFQEGGELQDWLEAEKQVKDQLVLNNQNDANRQLSEREKINEQKEDSQDIASEIADNGVNLPEDNPPHWLQGG
jgi:hypothetical protein